MSMVPGSPVAEPRTSGGADQLLEGLDPEQREVAEALRGPVRVLAGAGTGKTRAITHRIAYGVATGVYSPTQVLAVTFTTRAAGEMRTRLRVLGAHGVQARTFHSAALRQARYFWPKVYGGELPQLMDSKLPLVGSAARRNRVDTQQATLRDLASEIEWCKVSNVRPDDYARIAPQRGREVSNVDPATVARVFASYEDAKREAGRMDMEDILLCAAAILTEDDRVAAEVRRQYQHFVVDEFQDVSPIQSALLDLWLGDRDDLCVVGDPAQTIYSFAGASARPLLDFPRRHDGTTSIELVRNYRSTPQVIDVANRLMSGSDTRGVRLRSQQTAGPDVRYREHPDEVDEAEHVAAEVKALVDRGTPPSQVAVLFRINAQSEAFEEALAARGVPYVVRGAERFFQRAEVRQAVTLLRGDARGSADGGGTGDDLVEAARACVAGMGWTAEAPTTRGNARDRWESLQALSDLAAGFAEGHPGGHPGRLRRRPRPPRGRAARPGRRGRHHRHAAHRQGAGVGRGVPLRRGRGHPADHLRDGLPGRDRGGAPAALRRDDPGPAAPVRLLGPGPQPRRPGHPAAVPLPRRAAARGGLGPDPRRPRSEEGGQQGVPGLRRRRWPRSPSARSAGATPAPRPTTRSCSRGCAPGGRRPPRPSRSRRTSCSPTSPCRPSPRCSRAPPRSCWGSTGSAPPRRRSTARRCSRSSAVRARRDYARLTRSGAARWAVRTGSEKFR